MKTSFLKLFTDRIAYFLSSQQPCALKELKRNCTVQPSVSIKEKAEHIVNH